VQAQEPRTNPATLPPWLQELESPNPCRTLVAPDPKPANQKPSPLEQKVYLSRFPESFSNLFLLYRIYKIPGHNKFSRVN
jgi:hypothetical protein